MLAVVFEGCACRAAFHAGVAAALSEGKLDIKLTAGASSGAISAAGVAAGKAPALPGIWRSLGGRSVLSLRRLLWNRSPFDMSHLVSHALRDALGSLDLRQAPMEALLTATRIRGLTRVVFSSKEEPDLLAPLMASCFFPVLYGRPAKVRGELFLDGGFSDNLPIEEVVQRGATEVIAVVVSPEGTTFKSLRQGRLRPSLPSTKLHLIHPRKALQVRSWDFDPDRLAQASEEGYRCGRDFMGG